MRQEDSKLIKEVYSRLVKDGVSFNESLIAVLPHFPEMTYDRLSNVCIALNHMGNSKSKKESNFKFELASPKTIWETIEPEEKIEMSNTSDYNRAYKMVSGKKVATKESSQDFRAGTFKQRDIIDAFRKIARVKVQIEEQIARNFKESQGLFAEVDRELHKLVVEEKADLGAIKVAMSALFPEDRNACETIIQETVDYYGRLGMLDEEGCQKIASINSGRILALSNDVADVLAGTKIASVVGQILKIKKRNDSLKLILSKVADDRLYEYCKNSLVKRHDV